MPATLSLTRASHASDCIRTIRGRRVILDADLARLYGVTTKVFNQAIRRNLKRFPPDFMFQLTWQESESLTNTDNSRSQDVTLKQGRNVKYRPYAFTEHGAVMAANVLRSPRAVKTSVEVVRAFVQLREIALNYKELTQKIDQLESKYDQQFQVVFDAIRALMEPPEEEDPPRKPIGFKTEIEG